MRSATSSSQISNEVLPEESTATINISHKRNSSGKLNSLHHLNGT